MKAFLASFLATLVVLLALHKPDESAIGTRTPEAVAASARATGATPDNTDGSGLIIAQVQADCDDRLNRLLAEFPLAFDHQSEQLKSDSLQLIAAVTEVSADCPGSTLQIQSYPAEKNSVRRKTLTARRVEFLENRFRRNGVSTEMISVQTKPVTETSVYLTLAFKHP